MKHCIGIITILLICFHVVAQIPKEISLGLGNAKIVRYSPARDMIAITVGHKIKMFRSGIEVASLAGPKTKIASMTFDSAGEAIVVGYSNGKILVWNVRTRKLQAEFQAPHHPILECHFLEGSEKLAVLTQGYLSILGINGELFTENYNPKGNNTSMATAANAPIIAIACSDSRIVLADDQGKMFIEMNNNQKWVLSLAFTPDGKKLASGDTKGWVKIWDINKELDPITALETHGRINSLEFSYDGKYLAAGTESFFLLAIDEENPDVVYKKLNGAVISSSFNPNGKEICILEDLTPYAQIYDISDLNITPIFKFRDEGDVIAPQIYISNPPKIVNDRLNVTVGMMDIQGSIFDDFGVRFLKVNGIETPIKENGKFVIHVPLMMGENTVSLEAKDINGNIAVKKFIINRKSDTDTYDPLVARNFLFVVGIDDYIHWSRLNNAVKDGNDLASILMEDYNFKFSDITFLKNEQATRNNVFNGLRSMIEKVTPHDNLLIYFSGHGHFDELLNEGYWIPADAEQATPGDYLSNTSILKIIENINTQHSLLVADACFSGSLFSDSQRGGYYEKVEKFKSRWGLASGRLEAVSDGELGSNSPFSRVLLSYLNDNESEEFSVSELVQHVKIRVSEVSDQTPIGNPLRINGDEGGEFIFRKSSNLVTLDSTE
ncbi:MAG: caspase family protein [Bacteroidetes bacterium]|nr:caspase family protein [Bacteroidota bacterium]MDA1120821.1 caspase family protein [Bacteroidota bacterium]